jgi:hypothetical protein
MKTFTPRSSRFEKLPALLVFLMLALVLPGLSGCSRAKPRLSAIPNDEVAALQAADVCHIMQGAGFSDPQILDLGPDLRNALANQGAAQIQVGSRTEAILAVHQPYVHVSSRTRGTFVYDLGKSRRQ